jgi:hypothetical protein
MPIDSKIAVKNFLVENKIGQMHKEDQLINIVKLVAEIPWGEGRTIEEVLETKKAGTCTGKHLVLQACFDELGIKYRSVVCTFRWGEQSIKYPENLKRILKEGEWEHAHNFVQIKKENGDYIDADITWNSKLALCGFKTFPKNWDGKTAFVGIDNIIRRWDGVDAESKKKEITSSLELDLKERRENFLNKFIKWVEVINK